MLNRGSYGRVKLSRDTLKILFALFVIKFLQINWFLVVYRDTWLFNGQIGLQATSFGHLLLQFSDFSRNLWCFRWSLLYKNCWSLALDTLCPVLLISKDGKPSAIERTRRLGSEIILFGNNIPETLVQVKLLILILWQLVLRLNDRFSLRWSIKWKAIDSSSKALRSWHLIKAKVSPLRREKHLILLAVVVIGHRCFFIALKIEAVLEVSFLGKKWGCETIMIQRWVCDKRFGYWPDIVVFELLTKAVTESPVVFKLQ